MGVLEGELKIKKKRAAKQKRLEQLIQHECVNYVGVQDDLWDRARLVQRYQVTVSYTRRNLTTMCHIF